MSLDNIIKIHIEAQTINMVQAGFGTALVLGVFDHPDEWRVRSFSTLNELLEWKTELIIFDALDPQLSAQKQEEELRRRKEALAHAQSERESALKNTAVYEAVRVLLSQNPRVERVKIGRIKEGEDISSAFAQVCIDDDDFYGVLLPDVSKDALKLAELVAQQRMILGLSVNDKNQHIASSLHAKKNDRVFCIYDPQHQQLAAAWMGRMLTQAPGSSSWAFKELKEVKPFGLSTAKISELEKDHINRYMSIRGMGVCLDGKMSEGTFIDITCGIDWLHARMQERLFRLLMLNKKIPYTLKGIDLVRSEIMAQLKEGVYRGLLADEPEPFVSTPALNDIDQNIRSKRILPDVRFSARLAGAIHKIEIQGTVTV